MNAYVVALEIALIVICVLQRLVVKPSADKRSIIKLALVMISCPLEVGGQTLYYLFLIG